MMIDNNQFTFEGLECLSYYAEAYTDQKALDTNKSWRQPDCKCRRHIKQQYILLVQRRNSLSNQTRWLGTAADWNWRISCSSDQ